jgi:hypothetical protein
MRRQIARLSIVGMLALLLAGCTLRDWVSPFRGLNSDRPTSVYNEPEVGQYRQPTVTEYPPE